MHTIDDKRLEECRQFLSRPGPTKTRSELEEIVRDLTWAVEELQFRRLQERTPVKIEPDDRPYLLFGSDEAIVAFVHQHKDCKNWKQATEADITHLMPRTVRARKLDGADGKLWNLWEEVCRTYESPVEETESA